METLLFLLGRDLYYHFPFGLQLYKSTTPTRVAVPMRENHSTTLVATRPGHRGHMTPLGAVTLTLTKMTRKIARRQIYRRFGGFFSAPVNSTFPASPTSIWRRVRVYIHTGQNEGRSTAVIRSPNERTLHARPRKSTIRTTQNDRDGWETVATPGKAATQHGPPVSAPG